LRRLAGYDLQVVDAAYLPLQLELRACARPGTIAADVERGLRLALGSGFDAAGSPAFFHQQNFGFGEPLFVSRLFEAVRRVPGVASATIVTLAPLHSAHPGADTRAALASGSLRVAADQVIRLDDDSNFPEHGRMRITVEGGL